MSKNLSKSNIDRFGYVKDACGYNPAKDINPVAPNDSIDLHAAFESGFVPNDSAVSESDYQNVDDPRSIIGRPANEFEAIHMVQSLKAAHDEVSSATKVE